MSFDVINLVWGWLSFLQCLCVNLLLHHSRQWIFVFSFLNLKFFIPWWNLTLLLIVFRALMSVILLFKLRLFDVLFRIRIILRYIPFLNLLWFASLGYLFARIILILEVLVNLWIHSFYSITMRNNNLFTLLIAFLIFSYYIVHLLVSYCFTQETRRCLFFVLWTLLPFMISIFHMIISGVMNSSYYWLTIFFYLFFVMFFSKDLEIQATLIVIFSSWVSILHIKRLIKEFVVFYILVIILIRIIKINILVRHLWSMRILRTIIIIF